MKDLRIFISYSHDDFLIASALQNLLQGAFAPVLGGVFLDKFCIGFGTNIKDSVVSELRQADTLIAVIAGAQPSSSLSWPGFEIGTFSALWADEVYKQGPHKDREKKGIV